MLVFTEECQKARKERRKEGEKLRTDEKKKHRKQYNPEDSQRWAFKKELYKISRIFLLIIK